MSSIGHIRSTPGHPDGRWPPPTGMTPEENLADLRRHADDFTRRTGFTFTVLDSHDDDVLGCVDLCPSPLEEWDVTVQSWVRADRADLDRPLADAIAGWLAADWPWTRVDRCGRGFGFIALGQEAEDLFVHASEVVGGDGTKLLRQGQVVGLEIGRGDRGPQARRVRVTGERAADTPVGVLGTVAWYEPAKGYGFVTPDGGGAEIFVHSSAIVGGGVVSQGQRVAFLVVQGEKGTRHRDGP